MEQQIIKVKQCYRSCHFWGSDMDGMYCAHPYWKGKKPYSNMIISHDNSHNTVPKECPLRKEAFVEKGITKTYTL